MAKLQSHQSGIAHLVVIGLLALITISAVGAGVWRVQSQRSRSQAAAAQSALHTNPLNLKAKTAAKTSSETANSVTAKPAGTPAAPASPKAVAATTKSTPASDPKPTPVPAPTPSPTPTPIPTPNTNNCMPSDASSYEKAMATRPTSHFLGTDGYVGYDATAKFKAALEYAGLTSLIDSPKVVVFAPDDYVYNSKLTTAQLAFMNQSPANMRSVIGWHIITSCVIWHGNMQNVKTTMTLQTLNGPVTFTPSSLGSINQAGVAMWDWFTTNGAVHYITDFVKPPQV